MGLVINPQWVLEGNLISELGVGQARCVEESEGGGRTADLGLPQSRAVGGMREVAPTKASMGTCDCSLSSVLEHHPLIPVPSCMPHSASSCLIFIPTLYTVNIQ